MCQLRPHHLYNFSSKDMGLQLKALSFQTTWNGGCNSSSSSHKQNNHSRQPKHLVRLAVTVHTLMSILIVEPISIPVCSSGSTPSCMNISREHYGANFNSDDLHLAACSRWLFLALRACSPTYKSFADMPQISLGCAVSVHTMLQCACPDNATDMQCRWVRQLEDQQMTSA